MPWIGWCSISADLPPGGNNQLFRGLLLALIRETTINQPGKLFVLIDRGTFSAAVGAAADLENLTNSIFIGEPTAGAPSSWGDPKRLTLPNSGLVAEVLVGLLARLDCRRVPAELAPQIFPLHFRRRTTLQAAIRAKKRLTGSRNNPASLTFWRTC